MKRSENFKMAIVVAICYIGLIALSYIILKP